MIFAEHRLLEAAPGYMRLIDSRTKPALLLALASTAVYALTEYRILLLLLVSLKFGHTKHISNNRAMIMSFQSRVFAQNRLDH